MRPGWTYGTALIATGFALTGLIGLSRVYLGVHYLSDVSGGWALGVGARSRAAPRMAMVVTHVAKLRHESAGSVTFVVAKIGTEYFLFGGAG